MTAWPGFLLALAALLVISHKNLGLAMFVGAFILGVSTIPDILPTVFWSSLTDPATILLAIVVGMIPVIGGTLKASGQMDNLVSNLRIGKKAFLMLSPALIGMLPMPGGALLSAPLVEKGGEGIPNERKVGLNVWFRHVLYLVYPVSSDLIVSTEAAQLDMYHAIPYLVPVLFFSLFLGYLFFIKDISGKIDYGEEFSLRKLVPPLTALLIAPFLDASIKTFFALAVKEIATFIAVSASLLIAIAIGKMGAKSLRRTALDAKPWNFAFMMLGIMVFLDVSRSSGIAGLVRSLDITAGSLFALGFLLGFGTGRIVTPAGIIFPVFLEKFGAISLPTFAIIYFSIFLGYIMTPVHPCVSLSAEAFKVETKGYLKAVTPPTLIALAVSFCLLYVMNL